MSEQPNTTAWRRYQERLGNRTGNEEAAIESAFRAGWAACLKARVAGASAAEGRLARGLLAINAAADAPAEVLRSVAYDVAMNGLDPATAAFQIKRRAAAPVGAERRHKPGLALGSGHDEK